ncbi:MAG: nuclear transport factor 2 family protein [Rhodospirillaceae bacterium]|nr:nuclear transport factor 2 family protein [Rhodospirillaceae bacterium]
MSDLQKVIDKSQLADLVLTYCRACDRRDFALVRTLYHDDAIDEHGHMFTGTPDEFVAWLPKAMSQFAATIHHVTNMLFIVDGDKAQGEIYTIAYHRTPMPDAQEIIIGGRYLDHYEKRNGVWKFSKRGLACDSSERRAVDEEAYRTFAAGAQAGRTDHDDPSYQRLSLFKRIST